MSLTFETKRILAELFKAMADTEHNVETERVILAENSLFQPMESFRRIDRYSKGQLDQDDIIAFCGENGVVCTFDDATDLISQYDENSNGRMSFEEF